MEDLIRKFALQNAVRYKGKANPGSIVPKLLGTDPSLKSQMKELMPKVQAIVKEINELSLEEQTKQLQQIAPEMLEKKAAEKKGLKELDNVGKDGVIMRFAPSPSGPMHIGHAITGSLSSLYVKKYGGKFIMRIEDTNASNIYPPAYDMIQKEADWLFGNVSEYIIQSDRLEIYYEYANKLFEMDKLFVCTCVPEEYQEHTKDLQNCPCKEKSQETNIADWKKMLDGGFAQGEAIVRYKTADDLNNPALRNFPLFRINEEAHPKTGQEYRVWPLMNMSVTVDDIESGMTHIIRAKEHADNAKKQEMIFKDLGKPFPETYFIGRIKFTDLEISSSKTKARIEAGEFTGWDDIRLPFLEALRRRGYQAESFLRFSKEIGLSSADKVMSKEEYYKTLNAFNKEIIEPIANHYFMVREPVAIDIKGCPELTLTPSLHPDKNLSGRELPLTGRIYIEQEDYEKIADGEHVRLKDAVNIQKTAEGFVYHSQSVDDFQGKKIVHWLPQKGLVSITVKTPDGVSHAAQAEPAIAKAKEGDLVQFERFGFCRKDSGDEFWFAHR